MFSIGIEEEYQVINPQSRELVSHEQQIVAGVNMILPDQAKAEMHEAVVEVGTKVCKNIQEAEQDIKNLRKVVSEVARGMGYVIGASGTHPFSLWQTQLITENPRYHEIVNELQDTARSNLIFGLHVHVGVPDKDMAVHIANSVRYFLPHIYALSTNSPFWEGRNTGFKSYRSKVFDKFPRTGIPDYFDSYSEYENYVKMLVKTNCIDNAKKIWWDIRVHPFYDTIEFRICDVPMRADETVAIAALIQALVVKLHQLRQNNLNFMSYKRALINENKWRASRYGIDGKLIDFGKEAEVNTRSLIHELLEFVSTAVDEMGTHSYMDYIRNMLEQGTGADRQLKVYAGSNDLKAVVDYYVEQTVAGL